MFYHDIQLENKTVRGEIRTFFIDISNSMARKYDKKFERCFRYSRYSPSNSFFFICEDSEIFRWMRFVVKYLKEIK